MNTQQLSSPPPMVRLANGTYMRAQTVSQHPQNRRFLIVAQYFADDKSQFEELCQLIADLERVKNRDADILLFARADAPEPSHDIRTKLESKFERVLFERCRRKDAKGHPWGPNAMFYDMVTLFSQVAPWASQYFAFINLETDCAPTRPGWIHELVRAWKNADSSGKACIGFIHDDVRRHMNGVGVYAIDMWARVGSNKLAGGSPQVPFDIRHADSILPLAVHSPLFRFQYQRPTISAEELFAAHGGVSPAIWHGVKDGSARAAVRARHVTFTEQREVSRQTVVTFYESADHTNATECAEVLDLWKEGWKSRGWNPVVLSSREAVKHPQFTEIMEAVRKLPFVGHEQAHAIRFMRWIALARLGGGLMVDYDLIPADFTPHDLGDEGFAILDQETGKLVGLRLSREQAAKWVQSFAGYTQQPTDQKDGKPCVMDADVWHAAIETVGAGMAMEAHADGKLVHFSSAVVPPGLRKSDAIDSYLRAKA